MFIHYSVRGVKPGTERVHTSQCSRCESEDAACAYITVFET